MDLIKRVGDSLQVLLGTKEAQPVLRIREVIPGWDDDYPEPIFTDDWELTSEIDDDTLDDDYDFDDYYLTEKNELIAQYGWHNYEFVKDQDWVSDDLENYLGKYEG